MRKKPSPTLIGAFVVGAIALTVVAFVVFGSGHFFTEKYKFVAFFEGSVFGLNPGAPVICRGVKMGRVTDIQLLSDPEELTTHIAVFFETEPGRIHFLGPRPTYGPRERMRRLIERGLRARLEAQSFLTRQMMVVLDFHPEKPARLVGIDTGYPEVPTIRSPMQELMEKVERLPLEEIADSIRSALEGIQKVVESPDVAESLKTLRRTLLAAEKLLERLDRELSPVVLSFQETMGGMRKLVQDVDARVDPLASQAEQTLEAARLAIVQAEGAIVNVQGVTGEDSALLYQLKTTLAELAAASRSIRILADTLERHPEALLRGKGSSGGD